MNRLVQFVMALLVVGIGCKGEVVVKEDPQTREQLSKCENALKGKVDYLAELEKRVSDLELRGVVVTISGDDLKISGARGHGPYRGTGDPKGDAKDQEVYEAFLSGVRRSRGSIKRCYQNALKKNSGLQARTIQLQLQVRYKSSGKIQSVQAAPKVSSDFDSCLQSIVKGWTVPAMPTAVTFASKVTLTPQ